MPTLTALLLILAYIFVPEPAFANIVPCSGPDCQLCSFVQLGNSVLAWLIGIMSFVGALVIMVAGFKMVLSQGNGGDISEARSMITNTIVGFIILLAAWLIVDTVMKLFVGDTIPKWGPWNKIECVAQPTGPAETGTVGTGQQPSSGACMSGPCVPLGIACSASGCNIDATMAPKLQSFHAAAGISGARVTEAMPPSRTHRAACHSNGTCVDYSKSGGMTGAEVLKVINAAKANGLRPVYEVQTATQKKALEDAGVNASDILVLGSWISAPHFSIYNY